MTELSAKPCAVSEVSDAARAGFSLGTVPVGSIRRAMHSGCPPAAMIGTIIAMPLTVFDIEGVPGSRRERIEAAVVAGGRHARGPHEAWIAADPFKGGFRVLITGPQGFERTMASGMDDDPAVIADRVRETLEEYV